MLPHTSTCHDKQRERAERIASLPQAYHEPLTPQDRVILARPISAIVSAVQSSSLNPSDVLTAYTKRALHAHAQTNCLTEILHPTVPDPQLGVPVSLKDTLTVRGFDACIGYSRFAGHPAHHDSALVRLLRAAGAVPFVKTNVPTTMLSFECANDVFGRTENPHKAGFSPGLVWARTWPGAFAPSHYSGVYAIRSSMNRFVKTGGVSSIPGQEGVPATYSPMAKTLEDLETFWRAVFEMKPWEYDHSVLNIPWRDVKLAVDKPIRWGVLWDDGVVTPSPVCLRALLTVTELLQNNGHEIVALNPPSPYEGLQIASQLLFADGGKTAAKPFRWFESNDAGMVPACRALRLPRFIMRMYAWYLRYIRRDPIYAGLVDNFYEKSVSEYYALVAKREDYRARWFRVWRDTAVEGASGEECVDFILTVPNALPAVPHGGMRHGWKLDYAAGVMPITHVKRTDVVSPLFRARNAIERENYRMYDASVMEGLPVGIQIVGKRLDEERVLAGMKLIDNLLKEGGLTYTGIPL